MELVYSDVVTCYFIIGKNYCIQLYRSSSPLDGISAVFCMCLDQPVYIEVRAASMIDTLALICLHIVAL